MVVLDRSSGIDGEGPQRTSLRPTARWLVFTMDPISEGTGRRPTDPDTRRPPPRSPSLPQLRKPQPAFLFKAAADDAPMPPSAASFISKMDAAQEHERKAAAIAQRAEQLASRSMPPSKFSAQRGEPLPGVGASTGDSKLRPSVLRQAQRFEQAHVQLVASANRLSSSVQADQGSLRKLDALRATTAAVRRNKFINPPETPRAPEDPAHPGRRVYTAKSVTATRAPPAQRYDLDIWSRRAQRCDAKARARPPPERGAGGPSTIAC